MELLKLGKELKGEWSNHPNFKHMMVYADCPISMFWWDEVPTDAPTERYGIEIQHIKHCRWSQYI
jgi:hypothetical protein